MDNLMAAFDMFFQFHVIIGVFVGVFLGIILGSIPGLTATMAIALIIPMTFTLDPVVSVGLLVGAYKGGNYGGSIPAILLNTPGTPAASATLLDGHELAKQGKSLKALKMAIYASVMGDTLSDMVLILVAPPLAIIALKMGPPEMAALIFLSLLIITTVSGESMIKGLIVGAIGLVVGTIGLDSVTAVRRFGFGFPELDEGISLVPMLIGLFAVSEFLINTESVGMGKVVQFFARSSKPEDNRVSGKEFKACVPPILLSTGIGTLLGAIPGIGPSIAAFAGYAQAKKISKHPERFGKGALEGVAAAESGNNAVCGANLIPLLTLGIPGDIGAAVLLGAFMIQGLHPGPMLFQENIVTVYAIFMALMLANVFNYCIGIFYIRFASKVVLIPKGYIFPAVLAFCFFGAYGFNQSLFDVWIVVIFGLLGYLLRRNGFPLAPLLIAFMLEPILEGAFRQSLLMSGGSMAIFFTHPISGTFLGLTAVGIVWMVIGGVRNARAKAKKPLV
ncbi:MAG: tripartite tricarboxylate transporter permease [Proteobacteria bacterium]|nr:tripartite tricarboxylate transporter permease [Pseudomonadota bacterium]MBU4276848.1 tripartite tricarboxylate transporter permease [Pseudomonadota bacterium]MBU4384203.1 tripartite tricarboxylate transporter permease [Pseudomonadota bacterium]MBU4603900.1 tripartite tricarboxylate transporter permease [Pseudomonadota bacterium]MCG2763056.1 tripartite tricarboxylate transporter permease [Desulfarculaceae bacterium]